MAPSLIWDIQVEHLDEAEFLLEMWDNCIDSPKYTLTKLAAGPEARLLAHVDGLHFGAEATLEGLLLPVLAEPDDDEYRTAVAAFSVLEGAPTLACAEVLAALCRSEEPEGWRGVALGLGLSRREGLVPWVAHGLHELDGPALWGRLLALACHRFDAGDLLVPWLGAEDPELVRMATGLARYTASPHALRGLGPLVHRTEPDLRWTAIESGLIRGLPGAWELVCQEAAQPQAAAHHRSALGWVAMLGDVAAHGRLIRGAGTPSADLLWALGLTGRLEAVDRAVELVEHEELARIAAEVVCTIAGLPTRDDAFWLDNGLVGADAEPDAALPPFEEDDLDVEPISLAECALRLPNPEAVRAWWQRERANLEPGARLARGKVLDGARLRHELHAAPTRARHARALELAARTSGRAQLATRALTSTQLAQLSSLEPHFVGLDCQRGRPFAA